MQESDRREMREVIEEKDPYVQDYWIFYKITERVIYCSVNIYKGTSSDGKWDFSLEKEEQGVLCKVYIKVFLMP